jgi:membrane fusion protein (multidrug efflux system)
MNRRALTIVVASVAGLVAFLAAYKYWRISSTIAAAASFGEPAETVEVAEVRAVTWQGEASAAGTVVAREFDTLSNELAGTVARVEFESGQVVEAGQVLLELDTRSERAELRSAQADIELARVTASRSQRLLEQRAGTRAEVDRALAQLAQAEARREVVATAIARKTLRAPFRGRIGLRDVHPGQYLAQELAAQLSPGARVRLSGGALRREAEAVVRAIDARADEASRTVRVRAEASGLGAEAKPGVFVDVTVASTSPREVLVVPVAAVRRAAYGDHVFLIAAGADGGGELRAEQRFVTTGPVLGSEVVILDGLAAGDRVATEGSFKLRQGALVRVAPPGGPGS